jgi:hypothetical protein
LALVFIAVCALGIGSIFWQQEMKFALPTPKPQTYREVPVGTVLQLASFSTHLPSGAAFLHFYNPECPCSRFNASHLRQLIRSYRDSVPVIIVVPSAHAQQKAKKEFGPEQQYVVDAHNHIAETCGVYSTPQAVLVDARGALFYRGNYNRSRFCTSKATNFAELALVAMLNHQPPPVFLEEATTAYGCPWNEQLITLE